MKRVLIASTVVLAAALGFLVFQRLTAAPAAPPPATAAGHPAQAPRAAEPAGVVPPGAAPEPAAHAAHAAPAGPGQADPGRAEPPRDARAEPEPSTGGEGGTPRTPRLPVLRKPISGVAPPPHAAAAAARPTRGSPHGDPPARTGVRSPGPAAPAAFASVAAPVAAPVATPTAAPQPAAAPGPRLPGAVSGTLRSAAGGPVAGTSILALSAGGDDAFETVTDDDGFYLLAGMKAGRYLLFTGLLAKQAPALPARSVEVPDGRVLRVDLREPSGGATVRVHALRADGKAAPGQVLLVAGPVASPATLGALLASDAIFLPDAGPENVLRRVPAGVYTLVVLQGAGSPPRVGKQPVAVRGSGEQRLELRLPADVAALPAPPRG